MNSPESAVRAYFKRLNGSDVEAAVALFASDGSIMAEEAPSATGHVRLRGFFTAVGPGPGAGGGGA